MLQQDMQLLDHRRSSFVREPTVHKWIAGNTVLSFLNFEIESVSTRAWARTTDDELRLEVIEINFDKK